MPTLLKQESDNQSELFKVMVTEARRFFFGDENTKDSVGFAETADALKVKAPEHGEAILAAGLLVCGFTIQVDPVRVDAPSTDNPESVLNEATFMKNWHGVAPTVIDMGLEALDRSNPEGFKENVVRSVRSLGF